MNFWGLCDTCLSFLVHHKSAYIMLQKKKKKKEKMLALGVMVRFASFSSTAVMSASLHAGSRRARQHNKPLGDPDGTEEMILPQDTV